MELEIPNTNDTNSRAFHGTDEESAAKIVKEGFKYASCFEPLLGKGVYFFDGQEVKAKKWAEKRKKQLGHKQKISVIQSSVRYGRYLDLNDEKCYNALSWFTQKYQQKAASSIGLCTAIDVAAEQLEIDVILGTRVSEKLRKSPEGFSYDVEKIICVRKLENILSSTITGSL